MNSDIQNDVVKGLRELNQKGGIYSAAFDWMGSFQRSPSVTNMERLARELNISEAEARDLARELEEIGCGEVVLGRRQHKTRIVWEYSLRSMGNAAKGATKNLASSTEEQEDEAISVQGMIDHSFAVRPGYTVSFSLPTDVTAKEAERLATFIRSIPFSD